ncbi:MAG TPA: T9SS type A sorting domain-containing protein [Flavobacterium sp.]|nr:T9SS type A sorting domain-containing protein [Flavobacterium sp.]
MQKYIRLILLVILSGFGANGSSAQTTILDQTLLTEGSFNAFTAFSVSGSQSWTLNSTYGAVASGYAAGQNFENEDWLVSPIMNLTQTDNVKLSFKHTRGSAAVMNVGVAQGWYTVFATSSFTGDPATTQWIELEGLNQSIPVAWQYISSGELVIPEAAKSENSRIAFRYISSATQSASWEIKNVKVTGEPQPTNPNAGVFKITNWNTEWLGCTQFGPADESLQINNVAAAMLSMNSDIYCIQEVSNSVAYPSIATLVSLLGSDQWEGKMVPSNTGDCDQRQGIIYKKSKVQFVSSAQLSSGSAAQGNSYYYNCASGRYPALYNVNLVSGNTLVPLSLVNIHAKAEDGDAMSYTRRLGASQALKTILDGAGYNTKNLILIGDFNDYLIGTSSSACACTVSPYENFMDDESNYNGVTKNITDAHSWETRPIIENMVISNELSGNYILNSAAQEVAVSQDIGNYFNTTSDHLPVSATFQFSVLGNQEYAYTRGSSWSIYPNPVKAELKFDTAGLENDATTAIYDLTGRQMGCEKMNANTISVTTLPAGIYILKAGNRCGKFVKE